MGFIEEFQQIVTGEPWPAMVLAAAIISLGYGYVKLQLGVQFNRASWIASGRQEIAEGIKSVLFGLTLVGVIVTTYTAFSSIIESYHESLLPETIGTPPYEFQYRTTVITMTKSLTNGELFSPIGFSVLYLSTLATLILFLIGLLFIIILILAAIALIPGAGWIIALLLGIPVALIQLMLSASFIPISIQIGILLFARSNALTLLLPLGMILRSFSITRNVGAFLMGIVVVCLLVLPAFWTLTFIFTNEISIGLTATTIAETSKGTSNLQGLVKNDIADIFEGVDITKIGELVDRISDVSTNIANKVDSAFYEIFFYYFGTAGLLFVLTFIWPSIGLGIAGITLRELIKIFGGPGPAPPQLPQIEGVR